MGRTTAEARAELKECWKTLQAVNVKAGTPIEEAHFTHALNLLADFEELEQQNGELKKQLVVAKCIAEDRRRALIDRY